MEVNGKNLGPGSMIEEIDNMIKLMTDPDRDFLTEETMTKPLPRDTKIYSNNNKFIPFCEEGVVERLKAKKLLMEKGEATQEELDRISIELNKVKLRIKESGIQSRFDILDL